MVVDGNSATPWWRRLAAYILHHRKDLLLGLGVTPPAIAITSLTPVVFKVVVDDAAGMRKWLIGWTALLVGAAVIVYGLTYMRRYYGGRVAHHVQHELRTDVFRMLIHMDCEVDPVGWTGRGGL